MEDGIFHSYGVYKFVILWHDRIVIYYTITLSDVIIAKAGPITAKSRYRFH